MTKLFEIERKRQLGDIDGLLRSLQKSALNYVVNRVFRASSLLDVTTAIDEIKNTMDAQ